MKPRLAGLIAAPFTALLGDGSLNLNLIEQQATLLATNGVQGAFVCGTTGEGLSLTTKERMQIAERWVAVAPKGLNGIKFTDENLMSYVQCQNFDDGRFNILLAAFQEDLERVGFPAQVPKTVLSHEQSAFATVG